MKKHWTVWPKESYIWFLKTVGKGWNFHRSFGQMRCVSIFVDPTIHCVPAPISQPISLWQMFCRWRDVIAKARFINLGGILKWPFRNGDDCENMMEKMCWNRRQANMSFELARDRYFQNGNFMEGLRMTYLSTLKVKCIEDQPLVSMFSLFWCLYVYIFIYQDMRISKIR